MLTFRRKNLDNLDIPFPPYPGRGTIFIDNKIGVLKKQGIRLFFQ